MCGILIGAENKHTKWNNEVDLKSRACLKEMYLEGFLYLTNILGWV